MVPWNELTAPAVVHAGGGVGLRVVVVRHLVVVVVGLLGGLVGVVGLLGGLVGVVGLVVAVVPLVVSVTESGGDS